MSEVYTAPVLPDAEAVEWFNENAARFRYRFDPLPINPMPKYEAVQYRSLARLHDAWRSVSMHKIPEDPRAYQTYDELNRRDKAFLSLTGQDIRRSVYEHTYMYLRQGGRGFDDMAIYKMMYETYKSYSLFMYAGAQDSDIDITYPSYGDKPSAYKEVDRRLIMVAILELLEPADQSLMCTYSQQKVLLADPNIPSILEDGQAILDSVRSDIPYNQEYGFAQQTIHWNIDKTY